MNADRLADRLAARLGSWCDERAPPAVRQDRTETRDGFVVEHLIFDFGDESAPAILCRPADGTGPYPAILCPHAHGLRYAIGHRDLIEARPAMQAPAYGPVLAARGFVALSLDMPAFGGRQQPTEEARVKARLWQGATLIGDMLRELATALDYLAARDDVDAARLGAFGFSMGATHACWLAALEPRLAAVAHLCSFADLAPLIATGAHDLHKGYLTVPGLLADGDAGDIAALIAPRPQLIGTGVEDPLTHDGAYAPAIARVVAAYDQAGAAECLTVIREAASGHAETPRMRAEVLAFFDRWLG